MGPESVVNRGDTPSANVWQSWLKLGRVSNLPTVWTNAGTACVLSAPGAASWTWVLIFTGLMSSFYIGGMILNDAFDAEFDAKFRPARPIARGEVSRGAAFVVGFLLLCGGICGVTVLGARNSELWPAFVSAFALAATIVVYDAFHKNNPMSPILMGFCRALIYITAGLTLGALGLVLLTAALLQCCYVVGLTYAAKQEDLATPGAWWPLVLLLGVVGYVGTLMFGTAAQTVGLVSVVLVCGYLAWVVYATSPLFRRERKIGEAVGRLIAGIAALDAVLLSTTGSFAATGLALAALGLTRMLHRVVPGT